MKSCTCYEMLLNTCESKKGNIIFNGHKISMKMFLKNIEDFAFSLKHLGFEKGDVLTIYLPTCPQSLVAFYACSKIGVVANIVHPLLPLDKLKENLIETKSKGLMFYDILIKDNKALAKFNQILINCSITNYVVFRKFFYFLYKQIKFKFKRSVKSIKYSKMVYHNRKKFKPTLIEAKGSDVVCTMHSGGTVGEPKIVQLQNNSLNDLSVSLEQMYTRKQRAWGEEYSLVALPMFHAYGLGVCVHTCLTNKYSLILVPKFSPKYINKLMRKHYVTFFCGVPVMFKKMIEHKNFYGKHLQNLRDLWCGGDALAESFVEHFDIIMEKYKSPARLFRGYGLTEVASVCAANTFENYRKNSCGKPIPKTEIQVWDDDENILPPNTIGEIVVNSPSVMKGYLNGCKGFVVKDGKKWVKTGDLGYLDKDGFLFILDRKKRSIKISAINVFPSEIESLVKQNEFVDEACAVPYHYNEKTYIKLYITVKDQEINKEKLKRDLMILCQKNLIKYSLPKMIEIIDEMPRTPLGKVDFKKFQRV